MASDKGIDLEQIRNETVDLVRNIPSFHFPAVSICLFFSRKFGCMLCVLFSFCLFSNMGFIMPKSTSSFCFFFLLFLSLLLVQRCSFFFFFFIYFSCFLLPFSSELASVWLPRKYVGKQYFEFDINQLINYNIIITCMSSYIYNSSAS
jgi:hypothetical protein